VTQKPKPTSRNVARAERAEVSESAKSRTEDVALVYGQSSDGAGVRVIRKRADRVELGEIRPLEHGKPLGGEVVQLRQRGEGPLFDVEVQVPAPKAAALSSAGPAQVATDEYRRNWDAIWSKRKADPKLLN
jgi:hypothetical protein